MLIRSTKLAAALLACACAFAPVAAAQQGADNKEQARQVFETAFTLYQAQDFASAEVAFKRGLVLDPSSGPGNFLLAELLEKKGDAEGAIAAYSQVIAVAPNSAEAFKAEVARTKLAVQPPTSPEGIKRALVGWWSAGGAADPVFQITITAVDGANVTATGWYKKGKYKSASFDNGALTVQWDESCMLVVACPTIVHSLKFTSPTVLAGATVVKDGAGAPVTFTKK